MAKLDLSLTDDELDRFLAEQRTIRLATATQDGRPQVVPLWFVWLDRVVFMNSTLGNMSMVYKDVFQADAVDSRGMVISDVAVYRDGQYVGDIRPRKDFFGQNAAPMSIAGQYSTLESDFYILLTNWEGNRATFKIFLNPLVNLVWWGGIVLMLDGDETGRRATEEIADRLVVCLRPCTDDRR